MTYVDKTLRGEVKMEQAKSILVIYNPRAGKNSRRHDLEALMQRVASDADGKVVVKRTEYAGHAEELAARYGGDFAHVVCCGGDGTLSEVVNGLLKSGHSAALGYIPSGSTNDLANTIGIPTDLPGALGTLRDGHVNRCDVGRFNDRYYTYVASFGPGSSMSYSTSQRMKNLLGYPAYLINTFAFNLIPLLRDVRPRHIRIEYDGNVLEDDFYFGSVSNSLSVGGIFKFDPSTVMLDDGSFEVMLVRRIKSPLQGFPMLRKIYTRDYDGDTLLFLHASDIRFVFDEPEKWTLDGECSGDVTDVHIRVHHRALRLISPPGPLFEQTQA